jgi:hypothetical protein
LLPDNRADPLRLRSERQVSVELVRKPHAGNAPLAELPGELLAKRIGQDRGIDENGFNGSILLDGSGEMPDAFDDVAACAGPALGGLERAEG